MQNRQLSTVVDVGQKMTEELEWLPQHQVKLDPSETLDSFGTTCIMHHLIFLILGFDRRFKKSQDAENIS